MTEPDLLIYSHICGVRTSVADLSDHRPDTLGWNRRSIELKNTSNATHIKFLVVILTSYLSGAGSSPQHAGVFTSRPPG